MNEGVVVRADVKKGTVAVCFSVDLGIALEKNLNHLI